MNQKIKKHLTDFAISKGWETSDEELFEIILESSPIYKETIGHHRWYEDEFRVVNVNGMLIGYEGFHTTGDNGWQDMDLEHDYDKICEVEEYEVTVKKYKPVA